MVTFGQLREQIRVAISEGLKEGDTCKDCQEKPEDEPGCYTQAAGWCPLASLKQIYSTIEENYIQELLSFLAADNASYSDKKKNPRTKAVETLRNLLLKS